MSAFGVCQLKAGRTHDSGTCIVLISGSFGGRLRLFFGNKR